MRNRIKCYDPTCVDRYDCQLYTLEAEPGDGTVHEIPEDHVPGDEECEMYVPKQE